MLARHVAHSPWLLFASIAAPILASSLAITSSPLFARGPDVLAAAVMIDVALLVPIAYWLIVVRRAKAPARTVIPVAALSMCAASAMLPAAHAGPLAFARWLLMPAEVGLVAYVAWKVRSILAGRRAPADDADFVDAAESALERAIGNRFVARLIASELAILYFAVAPARRRPHVPDGAAAFPIVRSTMIVAALLPIAAVETGVLHVLVSRWSPPAAWALTALSVYSMLWVIGDFRAIALRPTLLTREALDVRVGIRCRAQIPYALIRRVDAASWRDDDSARKGFLNAAAPGTPNVIVTLREPVAARRLFGFETPVRSIALEAEDPAALIAALLTRAPGAAPLRA